MCVGDISRDAFDSSSELREDVERDGSDSDNHGKLNRDLGHEIPPWTHHVETLLRGSQVKRLVVIRRHSGGGEIYWHAISGIVDFIGKSQKLSDGHKYTENWREREREREREHAD